MDGRFVAETHVFDSKVYPGDAFFTITSREVLGEDNKVIGFHYAVHITEDDKTTNEYRTYLSEYEPKVVKYHRVITDKEYFLVNKEDISL